MKTGGFYRFYPDIGYAIKKKMFGLFLDQQNYSIWTALIVSHKHLQKLCFSDTLK